MTGSAIAGAYLLLFVGTTVTTVPMKDFNTCKGQGHALRSELNIPVGKNNSYEEQVATAKKKKLVKYYTCIETGY